MVIRGVAQDEFAIFYGFEFDGHGITETAILYLSGGEKALGNLPERVRCALDAATSPGADAHAIAKELENYGITVLDISNGGNVRPFRRQDRAIARESWQPV